MSMKDDLKDRQKSTHTHTQNFVNYHRDFKDYQRSSMDLLRSKLNLYLGFTEKHLLKYSQSTYRTEDMSSKQSFF